MQTFEFNTFLLFSQDKQKDRIGSKNALESYCFNMKSAVEDEKLKDKIPESDRNMIMQKCDEAIKWLDGNQTAEKDEYDDKLKELEGICNPIMTKLYQQAGAGAGGMPGGGAPGAGAGPTVEEVD